MKKYLHSKNVFSKYNLKIYGHNPGHNDVIPIKSIFSNEILLRYRQKASQDV